jgi:hypothetical protein
MQEAERPRAPGALSRLADPAGLASCLAALGQPSPLATDYARFGGEPALILLIPAQSGEVTIVVVGPSCGAASPGTGRGAADERYRTTVTR